MKFLFDLLPVIFFFAAYWLARFFPDGSLALVRDNLGGWTNTSDIDAELAAIMIATFVTILATALQIVITWVKRHKIDRMLWATFLIVALLGGLTIVLHNERFIQWKPTVLYWLIGGVLLGSNALFRRNLMRRMLESQIRLPDVIWSRVNLAWALFFIALGVLNLYVAFHYSKDAWVNFKMFGCTALVLVFSVAQGFYLSKHIIDDEPGA
ncbi:MAG: septation protein A [Azoarcus sp.]|jgi:intracellular septation protein|nr:septation protein A [Azoarcus sp.]